MKGGREILPSPILPLNSNFFLLSTRGVGDGSVRGERQIRSQEDKEEEGISKTEEQMVLMARGGQEAMPRRRG